MAGRTRRRLLGLAIVLAAQAGLAVAAETIIGTGATSRVHFNLGRAICRQLTKTVGEGAGCEVLPIAGRDAAEPLAVLTDVRNGAIEVGIVGADWQHHAVAGTGPAKFLDLDFETLRVLFSLHAEPFTIIARSDAGIDRLDDLRGKRVNIGNPGSGQRAMMEMVMRVKGWTRASFQLADELPAAGQLLALCHNTVQAVVTTVTHPDEGVAKAIALCGAKLVEVSGAEIGKLVAGRPYLAATTVPGGIYPGIPDPVPTFGVKVAAVSSDIVDEETAYDVVRSVFDGLGRLQRAHVALRTLTPEQMAKDGLGSPLHPGALRYYREKGLR